VHESSQPSSGLALQSALPWSQLAPHVAPDSHPSIVSELQSRVPGAQVNVQNSLPAPGLVHAAIVLRGPSGHARPHEPHAATVVRSASHPSSGSALQLPRPASQVNPHVPPLHVGVAFAGSGHSLLHVPQSAADARLVSQPSAVSPLQSA
jgi:hypothetical protein